MPNFGDLYTKFSSTRYVLRGDRDVARSLMPKARKLANSFIASGSGGKQIKRLPDGSTIKIYRYGTNLKIKIVGVGGLRPTTLTFRGFVCKTSGSSIYPDGTTLILNRDPQTNQWRVITPDLYEPATGWTGAPNYGTSSDWSDVAGEEVVSWGTGNVARYASTSHGTTLYYKGFALSEAPPAANNLFIGGAIKVISGSRYLIAFTKFASTNGLSYWRRPLLDTDLVEFNQDYPYPNDNIYNISTNPLGWELVQTVDGVFDNALTQRGSIQVSPDTTKFAFLTHGRPLGFESDISFSNAYPRGLVTGTIDDFGITASTEDIDLLGGGGSVTVESSCPVNPDQSQNGDWLSTVTQTSESVPLTVVGAEYGWDNTLQTLEVITAEFNGSIETTFDNDLQSAGSSVWTQQFNTSASGTINISDTVVHTYSETGSSFFDGFSATGFSSTSGSSTAWNGIFYTPAGPIFSSDLRAASVSYLARDRSTNFSSTWSIQGQSNCSRSGSSSLSSGQYVDLYNNGIKLKLWECSDTSFSANSTTDCPTENELQDHIPNVNCNAGGGTNPDQIATGIETIYRTIGSVLGTVTTSNGDTLSSFYVDDGFPAATTDEWCLPGFNDVGDPGYKKAIITGSFLTGADIDTLLGLSLIPGESYLYDISVI